MMPIIIIIILLLQSLLFNITTIGCLECPQNALGVSTHHSHRDKLAKKGCRTCIIIIIFFVLGNSFPKALEINKQIIVNYVRLGWSTNCLQVLPNEFVKLTALKR